MVEKKTLVPESSAAKSLFLGNILEENIFPYPELKSEDSETLGLVIDSISRFLEPKNDLFRDFDKRGEQSEEYIRALAELGLFGVIIPEQYGGVGLSNSAYARVIEETSHFDGSTALTIGAHSSIGMKGILLFGTEGQKQHYLPRLATGELIAAFCLTEPGSGSDAASIKTTAVKNEDGSWTLSGEKIWITNGAFAGVFTVFARTDGEAGKLTAFIVERAWKGVETGPKEDKMGIRASATTTVSFDQVHVPAENVLGGEGKGFKVAMTILNNGRTGLGGGCVGALRRCISMATQHAADRKQFGQSISSFDIIRDKISRLVVNCFATESVVGVVGHYIDQGFEDYSVEAAISKVFASEALWNGANEALQIAGGTGYMREMPYERIVRDSRINMIFEGTNEVLRLYIALSGLKVAGEYLKEIGVGVGKIFNDPIKGFGLLSGYATKRFTQLTSLKRDRLTLLHPALAAEAGMYERSILELSRATDSLLRKHRKAVVDKQLPMKRLADVAIDIFVGLCVLSRVSKILASSPLDGAVDELRIAKIFTEQARTRIADNLAALERPEDEAVVALSDSVVAARKYRWDRTK